MGEKKPTIVYLHHARDTYHSNRDYYIDMLYGLESALVDPQWTSVTVTYKDGTVKDGGKYVRHCQHKINHMNKFEKLCKEFNEEPTMEKFNWYERQLDYKSSETKIKECWKENKETNQKKKEESKPKKID